MDSNLRYFLLRRLHSLLGVFPLGIFLFMHLLTNSTGIFGAEAFEHKVALIHSLGPLLPLVEAVMIFIPLSFHICLGIAIAVTSRNNVGDLPYARNWAYAFQRWTGWVAVVFILIHVIELRFMHNAVAMPFSAKLAEMFKNPVYVIGYLVGSASVIFHFANGLCTFCMTWGLTVGKTSQKAMAVLASGVGVVLMGMLIAAVVGFARMDPQEAMKYGKHGKESAAVVAPGSPAREAAH